MREEGRERGDWVRSRDEIARRRQRRDRAAEVTGLDLEARSRGGGEGEHDLIVDIGDGFDVGRLDWRWVFAAQSDWQSRGSGTGSGLHRR